MSWLSWNCQGLRNSQTVRALHDLVKDRNPAFLFLSETLSTTSRMEVLRVKLGYDNCFAVDCFGHSGGLAILWKTQVQCRVTGYSRNHIDVVLTENNVDSWRLSCFYGYPKRSRRKDSWNFIRTLESLSPLPWCIWGDFNNLLFVDDKEGNVPHPPWLLEGFRRVIEDCQLTELDLKGGKFTWERGRGTNGWVKERLDRAFVSRQWWTKFPLCNLGVFRTSRSDHDPIQLDFLHINRSKKEFRFRFENTWLREPSFIKEVADTWGGLPATHLLPKLLSISSFMARWGRSFFHKFREKVKHQKEAIERLFNRTDAAGTQEYLMEKNKLNDLLLHEELYWKQRAKVFWLTEGDENTKFFHANASTRKRNNKVLFLVDEMGNQTDNHEEMCEKG